MHDHGDEICVGEFVLNLPDDQKKIIYKLVKKISKIVNDYELGQVALDLFIHQREIEEEMIEQYNRAKIQEN